MHLCTLGSLILIEPFTHTLHNSFFGIRYLPKVRCLLWPKSLCLLWKIYFTIFTWEVFHANLLYRPEILLYIFVRLFFWVPLLTGFWLLILQLPSFPPLFTLGDEWIQFPLQLLVNCSRFHYGLLVGLVPEQNSPLVYCLSTKTRARLSAGNFWNLQFLSIKLWKFWSDKGEIFSLSR